MLWSHLADGLDLLKRDTNIDMRARPCCRGHIREVAVRTPLPLSHSNATRAIRSNPGLARWGAIFHITRERRQVLLDRLAAFAVLLLVLATLTMFALYVAHELPGWRAGQISGFESMSAPAMSDSLLSAAPTSAAQTTTLSRVPLVLISIAIEMAIFVGLGLYLRHEMNRLP